MTYELGTIVNTPKGKGEVVYAEDGYIEVSVKGADMGFEMPSNLISEYVEPEKSEPKTDMCEPTPEYDAICQEAELDEMSVLLAKTAHTKAAMAVRALNGEAASWEDLNSFQKLNFIKMATGVGFEDIKKEAQNAGMLDKA